MKMTRMYQTVFEQHSSQKTVLACVAFAIAGLLTACGGSTAATSSPAPTPTPTAKTVVQINVGDAPADWMLAFSINVTSMSLTGSNGSVNVVTSPVSMEMMHLMGTMQPLAMMSAPQGSYTGASISIASATIQYMDPNTKSPVQKMISGPITGTMTFPAPIAVGMKPMVINFDMDLAGSVTADASGTMTLKPMFNVTSGTQGSGSPSDPANGGIQQMMGTVSSTTGTSFTMTSLQAMGSFTFDMNASTGFENVANMGMIASGMLVGVDASLQPDGSLIATHVRSMMNSGGAMGGGIVTAVAGQPATQLTLAMRNGAGTGMMSSNLAGGVTANLNGSTIYLIDKDNMDMTSLPFAPMFDASHIYAGQSAMPISSSGMMGGGSGGMMGGSPNVGTITASEVDLEQQGLSGTISTPLTSASGTGFTLTLPSDSAFGSLTGAATVTIYQQPGTTMSNAPIASGARVHVLGLLFVDSGQWKMVASRIGPI